MMSENRIRFWVSVAVSVHQLNKKRAGRNNPAYGPFPINYDNEKRKEHKEHLLNFHLKYSEL